MAVVGGGGGGQTAVDLDLVVVLDPLVELLDLHVLLGARDREFDLAFLQRGVGGTDLGRILLNKGIKNIQNINCSIYREICVTILFLLGSSPMSVSNFKTGQFVFFIIPEQKYNGTGQNSLCKKSHRAKIKLYIDNYNLIS